MTVGLIFLLTSQTRPPALAECMVLMAVAHAVFID
jgi:hypothetical protein